MAKPFIKWAGGKRKLLGVLEANLPADLIAQPSVTYIEPFVGGGAMLFNILATHSNVERAIINDINPALVNCYKNIKNKPDKLLQELRRFDKAFYALDSHEQRRNLYYAYRDEYNCIPVNARNTIRSAALFIFFNKTCFNGLYRENNQGKFNVPFGRYVHPTICNEEVIYAVHEALQNVNILCGDYNDTLRYIDWNEYNFFYLDPPYRPLLGSNNFKQYTMNSFDDPQQIELKEFCDEINAHGGKFLLSNSDSEIEESVNFFEKLYAEYNFQRIYAPRTINAFVPGVEKSTEVLIKNY